MNKNKIFTCLCVQNIKLIKPSKPLHIKELFTTNLFETLKYFFTTLMKINCQHYTKIN